MSNFAKITVLTISLLFFRCQSLLAQNEVEEPSSVLSALPSWDTIYVFVQYVQCGEWGGNQERCSIYKQKDSLFLDYTRYVSNCDSAMRYGNYRQIPVTSRARIPVNHAGQACFREFVIGLFEDKLKERIVDHAGYVVQVNNKDRSFMISQYSMGPTAIKLYEKFISCLIR